MNAIKHLFLSIATGSLCVLTGLLFEIIGGAIAWNIFRGVEGILFATVIGGLAALLIRQSIHWPASSTAGAVGAFVAAYFTISCMEVYEPGSLEWAVKGGLYGAAWGLPVGMILGPIGLIRRKKKKQQKLANNTN